MHLCENKKTTVPGPEPAMLMLSPLFATLVACLTVSLLSNEGDHTRGKKGLKGLDWALHKSRTCGVYTFEYLQRSTV